jgi:hypothetical protein
MTLTLDELGFVWIWMTLTFTLDDLELGWPSSWMTLDNLDLGWQ